jgi:hypothetical protein
MILWEMELGQSESDFAQYTSDQDCGIDIMNGWSIFSNPACAKLPRARLPTPVVGAMWGSFCCCRHKSM